MTLTLTKNLKRLTIIIAALVVVLTGSRANRPLSASAGVSYPLTSGEYQTCFLISSGIAQALLSSDTSLLTLSITRHITHPLGGLVRQHSALTHLLDPVEIREVLVGDVAPDQGLLGRDASRYFTLESQLRGGHPNMLLQELAAGGTGPYLDPSVPLFLGVFSPVSDNSLWATGAREEFDELSMAGVFTQISALEPFHGWTIFPVASAPTSPDTPSSDLPALDQVSAAYVTDLKIIASAFVPPSASAVTRIDFIRSLPQDTFRRVKELLVTDLGRMTLDQLENLSSERVIPKSLAVDGKYDDDFAPQITQPDAQDIALLFGGSTNYSWSPTDQGVAYELKFDLGQFYPISKIDIDWAMDSAHAPIDLFVSDDGGAHYQQVDRSRLIEIAPDRSTAVLDLLAINSVKIRYNYYSAENQLPLADIAEISVRYRPR